MGGQGAGRLIEAAGLKGHRIGSAQVSPVHANFFLNEGGAANATDYYALVRHVQRVVAEPGDLEEAGEVGCCCSARAEHSEDAGRELGRGLVRRSRELDLAERLSEEALVLPGDLDLDAIAGLSNEVRARLLGQLAQQLVVASTKGADGGLVRGRNRSVARVGR